MRPAHWKPQSGRIDYRPYQAMTTEELTRCYLDAEEAYAKRGTRSNHNHRAVLRRLVRERVK